MNNYKLKKSFSRRMADKKVLTAIIMVFVATTIGIKDINAQKKQLQSVELQKETNKIRLIALPYPSDALEPIISRTTIELHHGKHLASYVNNLNNLIPGTKFENADLETIVRESEGAVFNNAGQVLNHNLYFTQFTPKSEGHPSGKLLKAIEDVWGTFENFKKEFETAGSKVFGSGWVWLAADQKGKLQITIEANGGNPITKGLKPIFGIDLWEHAYYLDYQNRRADHLKEIWKIVSWSEIARRYKHFR